MTDEKHASAIEFLQPAVQYNQALGVRIKRVLPITAVVIPPAFRNACDQLGIRHRFTRPYRPRTDGEAERFIQTLIKPHLDGQTSLDASTGSVFNFITLLAFSILAAAAIGYRSRPDVHKRLMLFANITLMAAPIAHLVGHIPRTWPTPPAALFTILSILFLVAVIAGDYLIEKRIRFLTAAMAIGWFAIQVLDAFVIAPKRSLAPFCRVGIPIEDAACFPTHETLISCWTT